jgi:hypothetical protein
MLLRPGCVVMSSRYFCGNSSRMFSMPLMVLAVRSRRGRWARYSETTIFSRWRLSAGGNLKMFYSQVQEIPDDERRKLVALPGIEPGFED